MSIHWKVVHLLVSDENGSKGMDISSAYPAVDSCRGGVAKMTQNQSQHLLYGSKYLLRKCSGYGLGGSVPSKTVFGSIGVI